MVVVDLNLLVYATNSASPHHAVARCWWEDTLSGDEMVGMPWVVLLGYLRLTVNPAVMPAPLTPEQALAVIDGWLSRRVVRTLVPTERHWGILRGLIREVGAAGNLTTDAHLAAVALEHGATLCSSDRDFGRFPGLRWKNPLVDAGA